MRRYKLVGFAGSLAIALGALLPATASAGTFAGINGRILMTDITGAAYHFTSVKPDGTDSKTVISDGVSKVDVEYSPDGTKIAYAQIIASVQQIFVANADGSNPTQITSSATHTYSPSWSPDGTKLLYSKAASGPVQIYRMNSDGSNQTQITSTAKYYDPEYSPDGTKILALLEDTDNEVVVMNADGSNIVNLTSNSVDDLKGSWSPSGNKIIYSSLVSSFQEIFTMNPDGSSKTQLTSDGVGYHAPEYSPDGTKIAFIDTLAPGAIYVANADGTSIQSINIGWPREISWQSLTKTPSSSTPNPTMSLVNGKTTIDIASMFTDSYEGIDKSTVAVTTAPTYGTTSVDTTNGKITYTSKSTAARKSLLSTIGSWFVPKASAAATDSFNYKICSLANSNLCGTGTVTVSLVSSPNTGAGMPSNAGSIAWALAVLSLAATSFGIRTLRRGSKQS